MIIGFNGEIRENGDNQEFRSDAFLLNFISYAILPNNSNLVYSQILRIGTPAIKNQHHQLRQDLYLYFHKQSFSMIFNQKVKVVSDSLY